MNARVQVGLQLDQKSARFAQEESTKLEQDAMLAGAGEEGKSIMCFDDIIEKGAGLAGCEASTRTRVEVSARTWRV